MSVQFQKFHAFVQALAAGEFAQALNGGTDTLKAYLSNTTPDAARHAVKSDLAEIPAGLGYVAGGFDTQHVAIQSAGIITVAGMDGVIMATGGPIGPFRYVVLYDDTPTSDPLIGFWDYGLSVTLQDGELFEILFGSSLFTVE